jgi:hypothetical protein
MSFKGEFRSLVTEPKYKTCEAICTYAVTILSPQVFRSFSPKETNL